jgi:transposase
MPAQRKYPDELRERAVKMVLEIRAREGKGRSELSRVGRRSATFGSASASRRRRTTTGSRQRSGERRPSGPVLR